MANIRTLIWYFYRPAMIINVILTGVCLFDLFKIGIWFIGYTIFVKLIGYAATIGYKSYFANKTYMYYRNSGYSITRMYTYTFTFDIAIYLFIAALLIPFIPHHAHIKG
jgi:hypothetical protein